MTVVLALRCADGVAMASDSQITDSARGLSYPAQKLHPLGSHAAWGGSGSRAVLYDVEQIFNTEADTVVEAKDIGHALQERLLPVFKRHYANFIEDVPAQKSAGTPATYVLAAGYSGDVPFIIDLDPNGLDRALRGNRLPGRRQRCGDGPAGTRAVGALPNDRAGCGLRSSGGVARARCAGRDIAERRCSHGHLSYHL